MSSDALFPSRLGVAFSQLDPQLQWVHSGESRTLSGTVTVERGASAIAKILGALTSLPPTLRNAPIEVRIDGGDKERWTRTYAGSHVMSSTLYRHGEVLAERVGPGVLTFRVIARDTGMDWQLEKVSMLGIPPPATWFQSSARVDMQQGRYHFLIDSALRGVGRIVRYEGLLDVGPRSQS
jgi:hypothetical protein